MTGSSPAEVAVLLGASNLRMSFPRVLALAVSGCPQERPVRVLAALGHGRSYGLTSNFAGVRTLPSILDCGLWEALARTDPQRAPAARAVLSDVGNDLAYGAPAGRIADWVATCSDRLGSAGIDGPDLTLVALPVASLERLTPFAFAVARRLLFPFRPLELGGLLDATRELDGEIRRLARERGHRLVEPPADWYGRDRIHLARSHRAEAWRTILGVGEERAPEAPAPVPPFWWLRVAEARWLGSRRTVRQPAFRLGRLGRLEEGTAVELY